MRMPDELRDALLFIPEVGVNEKNVKTINPKPYLMEGVGPVLLSPERGLESKGPEE